MDLPACTPLNRYCALQQELYGYMVECCKCHKDRPVKVIGPEDSDETGLCYYVCQPCHGPGRVYLDNPWVGAADDESEDQYVPGIGVRHAIYNVLKIMEEENDNMRTQIAKSQEEIAELRKALQETRGAMEAVMDVWASKEKFEERFLSHKKAKGE